MDGCKPGFKYYFKYLPDGKGLQFQNYSTGPFLAQLKYLKWFKIGLLYWSIKHRRYLKWFQIVLELGSGWTTWTWRLFWDIRPHYWYWLYIKCQCKYRSKYVNIHERRVWTAIEDETIRLLVVAMLESVGVLEWRWERQSDWGELSSCLALTWFASPCVNLALFCTSFGIYAWTWPILNGVSIVLEGF
jgi:hypothetical protein